LKESRLDITEQYTKPEIVFKIDTKMLKDEDFKNEWNDKINSE